MKIKLEFGENKSQYYKHTITVILLGKVITLPKNQNYFNILRKTFLNYYNLFFSDFRFIRTPHRINMCQQLHKYKTQLCGVPGLLWSYLKLMAGAWSGRWVKTYSSDMVQDMLKTQNTQDKSTYIHSQISEGYYTYELNIFCFSFFLKTEMDLDVFRLSSSPFQICGPLVVMLRLVHFSRLFLQCIRIVFLVL